MSIEGKSVLAIIPAREGSKRIPLKNLTLYRGLPLIQHAINHAKESKYIDQIAISSDSEAILIYAKPPIIPITRPPFLASDQASSEALIAHTLYHLPSIPNYLVLLQPTSPLRTAQDIDICIERAHQHSGQCVSFNEYGNRNGAIYVSDSLLFLSTLTLRHSKDFYIMPNSRSLDIDYTEDFLK